MKGYYFFFFLIVLHSCKSLAQQKNSEFLTERITYNNYAVITITHNAERYSRTEVNLIYRNGNRIKIHSIVKEPSSIVDTVFVLNGTQIMFIDRFERDVQEDKINSKGVVIAGSKTNFEITLGDTKSQLINKTDYSLLKELLQLK